MVINPEYIFFFKSYTDTTQIVGFSWQADSFQASQNRAAPWYKYNRAAAYDTIALYVI